MCSQLIKITLPTGETQRTDTIMYLNVRKGGSGVLTVQLFGLSAKAALRSDFVVINSSNDHFDHNNMKIQGSMQWLIHLFPDLCQGCRLPSQCLLPQEFGKSSTGPNRPMPSLRAQTASRNPCSPETSCVRLLPSDHHNRCANSAFATQQATCSP